MTWTWTIMEWTTCFCLGFFAGRFRALGRDIDRALDVMERQTAELERQVGKD